MLALLLPVRTSEIYYHMANSDYKEADHDIQLSRNEEILRSILINCMHSYLTISIIKLLQLLNFLFIL